MEHPFFNDCTFSSANPSLSEIWPHFPSQNKRNHSLSENHSTTKHRKPAPPNNDQNAAFKPEPNAISANKQQQQNQKPFSELSPSPSPSPSPPPKPKPKQDYIHVRARRGQATDSHSLAERARREKISERMKILQDLVPGCNKVVKMRTVFYNFLYIE
ncbi:hypothetical protein KIW84_041753 [Lathyrus oleraceus]|uniref:BHLH domain-containing protein n=1 Tax=Pisum sativum TaxID=3888 RepID=A0A9D5ARM3_PEA|nr:hypothetical protein KIW84_041753 [Pisum sativum]